MADYLASIYGTEKDKVNCSFYFKIGACRHGDRCSRKHVKPTYSQTVLISNMYQNPLREPNNRLTPEQAEHHFNDFFEDMFCELAKYGEIEDLKICDNEGDHLVGNVYVQYLRETDAQAAVDSLNDRYYAQKPVYAELSPVTDFREACCRQHENGNCDRGGFCNFMHIKHPRRELERELYEGQALTLKMFREEQREEERHHRQRD
ncbi:hypothetical protein EV182_007351 [Spiromyces aspiralis]|uniref:Uncharacterized protein n=1 Tax=Spiromyces aspiralis TaxID=68401 RepID=A0ACC1HEI3_9FUNG|nr:hypothetical protein EV182_007351 [Spiromyces aspiralis]